jgi:hypothetical protein
MVRVEYLLLSRRLTQTDRVSSFPRSSAFRAKGEARTRIRLAPNIVGERNLASLVVLCPMIAGELARGAEAERD